MKAANRRKFLALGPVLGGALVGCSGQRVALDFAQLGQQLGIPLGRAVAPPVCPTIVASAQLTYMRARQPHRAADRLHWSSPGNKGERSTAYAIGLRHQF